jgi:hypothetical protein
VNTLSRIIIATSGVLAVAACGGGGGGGDSGSAPVVHTASTEITSANAPVIAGSVVKSTSRSDVFSSMGGFMTPVFASSGQVTVSAIRSFKSVGTGSTGTMTTDAVSSGSTACAVSGSVTLSADITSSATLPAGDHISFTYQDCDQGEGAVLDGGFEMTVRTFQGDVANGSFLMTVDLAMDGFGVLQDGQGSTIDGGFSMTLDTRDANALRIEVSGETLDLATGSEFASLADFRTAITVDTQLQTSTLEVDGYLMSSAFSGEVRYETLEAFDLDAAGMATAGRIRITGARNATIEITILGEQNAQLDIDVDGNGVVDEVVTVSWTELNG